ncbi:MAG: DUF4368 domain-containing protein [Bacteroidales bacterium]|nr:DUF4368 domain-containing protein [Bacteroidales bacterium]
MKLEFKLSPSNAYQKQFNSDYLNPVDVDSLDAFKVYAPTITYVRPIRIIIDARKTSYQPPALHSISTTIIRISREQSELRAKVQELEMLIEEANNKMASTDHFLEVVKNLSELKELTHEVVRELIEKVVIHKTERVNGKKTVKIDIYYNGLGKIDLPIENA